MDNLCYTYINIWAPHQIHFENAGRHFFFFFFGNRTGECSFFFFLAAEDFELYYRLARSYNKLFLSQLNSEMKFPKVGLVPVGNIITQEPLIQSI